MKQNSNQYKLYLYLLMATLISSSCNKILDKQPLTALTTDNLYSSYAGATSVLDGVAYNEMPGMAYGTGQPGGCAKALNNWFWDWDANTNLVQYGNSTGTDEACPTDMYTSAYLKGTATFNWLETYDNPKFGGGAWGVQSYADIRTCNQLIAQLANYSFSNKNYILGQAFFFRALVYHNLVKDVGGVPLILTPQTATDDLTQLQMPRNKTSECVAQILMDLDSAIALLPDQWTTAADKGRVDKTAVMAYKGRVLLFYASPLFNGLNGLATWQKAYDVNLAAKQQADAQGKGLYYPYGKIWDDKDNKEVIMVRKFSYPTAFYAAPNLVPLVFSADDWESDCPSLELVNAFPMKDGSKFVGSAATYPTLFKNRDDRFYATVGYNGAPNMFTQKWVAQNTYYWSYVDAGTITADGYCQDPSNMHNNVTPSWTGQTGFTNNFFYRVKGVDKNAPDALHSANDWPEIRYAEVLMNLAEAANEISKTTDALEYLSQIRQRAGIDAGFLGNYGITATSQADVRTAIQNERFVEFAFENRRWDDLRRWKMFDYLRNLKQRHNLAIIRKVPPTGPDDKAVTKNEDINTAYTKFNYTVINTDDKAGINIPDKYYIFGLPFAFLNRNPKLDQNKNWGGGFDPFQ